MEYIHIYRHYCYILTCPTYIMVRECFNCMRLQMPRKKIIFIPLVIHYIMALYKILFSGKVIEGTKTTEE